MRFNLSSFGALKSYCNDLLSYVKLMDVLSTILTRGIF